MNIEYGGVEREKRRGSYINILIKRERERQRAELGNYFCEYSSVFHMNDANYFEESDDASFYFYLSFELLFKYFKSFKHYILGTLKCLVKRWAKLFASWKFPENSDVYCPHG